VLQVRVQHVLVLVDGNQTFFNSKFISLGTAGTKEAVESLVKEAKYFAQDKHKNDLPENLSIIVHIFVDVGQLADDLSSANLLPNPDQLWLFIQDASKLEPGITISDCGSGHEAVDAKMKCESCHSTWEGHSDVWPDFYELYLENCHCRHLFLALGHSSEYYKVLSTYGDDEYTVRKTSVVKPTQGLPREHQLPFHTVEFSSLESVHRHSIPYQEATPKINGSTHSGEPVPNLAKPALNAAPPVTFQLNPTANNFAGRSPAPPQTAPVPRDVPKTKKTALKSSRSEPAPQANTNGNRPFSPHVPIVGLQSSVNDTSSVSQAAPQITPAPAVVVSAKSTLVEDSTSAGVIKLDTSSHSSYHSNNAEQSWETAVTNSYTPDPVTVPWGEETHPQPGPESTGAQATYLRRNNANFNRRQPKQGSVNGGGGGKQGGRRMPKQFEGSWDDMVGSQGSSTSPQPLSVSVSLSATSKSIDLANVFARQVVTKPEPNPQRRPVDAPIALNKLNQRIDLKLPQPSAVDEEAFKLRTNNRHLCNEHHMRGKCADVKCAYDHEDISDGVYLALRNKARYSACNRGSGCRRHDCYLAHHCPNMSKASPCGRPSCPFKLKGLHDVIDLEIFQTIERANKVGDVLIEGLL
jgi:hypothetical protein